MATSSAKKTAELSPFEQAMRTMLPPTNGVAPHATGQFGEHRHNHTHQGVDFNYEGGQSGINLLHPTIHSPVSGTFVSVGKANNTINIRDDAGNLHQIMHTHSQVKDLIGKRVEIGTPIGTMGGTESGKHRGEQHIHYQVTEKGKTTPTNPIEFWNHRQPEANHRPHDKAPHTPASAPPPQSAGGIGYRLVEAAAYQQAIHQSVANREGNIPTAYIDSRGNITIGEGFNIHGNLAARAAVFKAMGLIPNNPKLKDYPEAQANDNQIIAQLNQELNKSHSASKKQPHPDNDSLVKTLDSLMQQRAHAGIAYPPTMAPRTHFQLAPGESQAIFKNLTKSFENQIDKWAAKSNPPLVIPPCREREVLFDLAYNSRVENGTPTLLGPKLREAIATGNRAEAYFEICYHSNSPEKAQADFKGIAYRRFHEAADFGLYKDPKHPTEAELRNVVNMVEKHRPQIEKYEEALRHSKGYDDKQFTSIMPTYEAAKAQLAEREKNHRIANLPLLENAAGAAYTLYQHAKEAIHKAANEIQSVNWKKVEASTILDSLSKHGQTAEHVKETLFKYSPGAVTHEAREMIAKGIDHVIHRLEQVKENVLHSDSPRQDRHSLPTP
ncbi:MAG: M23 family metallopeptidase [Betaproteobacteria bacterium]|nr:M23 family metallopeptidase [Betaproteobacteria bacterium]